MQKCFILDVWKDSEYVSGIGTDSFYRHKIFVSKQRKLQILIFFSMGSYDQFWKNIESIKDAFFSNMELFLKNNMMLSEETAFCKLQLLWYYWLVFLNCAEVYSELLETSMIGSFAKKVCTWKSLNYFRNKGPSYIFDRVRNTPMLLGTRLKL